MEFTNEVTIKRPVRDVFAYLADFENVPEWNYAITQTRKTSDGPVGVGTRYVQTRSIPRPGDEAFEVITYEPEKRLAIRGDIGPFHGVIAYELEPVGVVTRVMNRVELEARGVARLAVPLAGGRVRDAVAANLGELRELLEA
jgi:uncharacterized protein YndB with AHSA1/START domain